MQHGTLGTCRVSQTVLRLVWFLLQFGLFHGDPHPGNIFAMPDGRIAYVDFGNVAELSQANKQVLIDAIVHAVNEDYEGMADDFIKLVRCGCLSFQHCTLPAPAQEGVSATHV